MIIDVQNYEPQIAFPVTLGLPYTQVANMKVKDLALIDCSVDVNLTIRDLTKLFEFNQDWPGVILISNHASYGMITRHHCYEVLGKPFGIEVFSRKTLFEFYNSFEQHYLLIDAESTIQDAVKTALARDRTKIFEPIIVRISENVLKMLNMHTLLLAQCDVLENLYDEFYQLSVIDPLTQLNNRRGFFESAQPEVVQSQINQNDLSALMIDLDNFKKTNDLYGHTVGDQVLCAVAEEIKNTLRQTDLLGRYGGEEFIALLPNTSIESALIIAERLREAIELRVVQANDLRVSVTASIGICHIRDANNSLDTLLSQADQAMYWSKTSGRNKVSLWTNELARSCSLEALQRGVKIKAVQKKKGERFGQISKVYDETIEGWSKAIEMRDKEMEGHAHRVVELTLELARKCGVREKNLADIRRGALLHDIGKIAIPDPILFKPGKLTESEWEIMRKHPVYAYEFLSPVTFLNKIIDIPYCHHEHWDGSGYPRGLKGEEIPLAARIFSIIDVWDALCTDRCYRPAWPQDEARNYIIAQSGILFDPAIVKLFIELLNENKQLFLPVNVTPQLQILN